MTTLSFIVITINTFPLVFSPSVICRATHGQLRAAHSVMLDMRVLHKSKYFMMALKNLEGFVLNMCDPFSMQPAQTCMVAVNILRHGASERHWHTL